MNKNLPDDFLIDTQLNTIIANSEQASSQLTAIDKQFRGHMIRQILLEHELQDTLCSLTTAIGTTKDGDRQRN